MAIKHNRAFFGIAGVAFFLALAAASFLHAASPKETAPKEVIQAAMEGLQPFLESIPQESMANFGLDGRSPARLGAPYKLYTITPAAMETYKSDAPADTLVSETSMWHFPVLVGEETKAILVVDNIDGQWEAVSLGYPEVAAQTEAITKQWPKSRGYNPLFIAVFQASEFLFSVPEADPKSLTSIDLSAGAAANKGMGGYSRLDNVSDTLSRLRPEVRENLRSGRE
ncbi:MAG: hypothetical protein WCK75_11165 [Elusimicrobiota bacterium]